MATSQISSPRPSALGDFGPSATLTGFAIADAAELRRFLGAFLNVGERCMDGLAVFVAIYCAYTVSGLVGIGSQATYSTSIVLLSAAAFALLFVMLLDRRGGYRPYVSLLAIRDTERILRVTAESLLLALLVAYFTTQLISRVVVLIALVTVPFAVIIAKWEMRRSLCFLRAKGYATRKAVIVGADALGRRIYSALVRSPKFGLDPVAFVDEDPQKQGVEIYESSYQRKRATRVLAGPVCPELLRQLEASVLVIATTSADRERLIGLASAAAVDTYCVREDFSEAGFWIDHANFDGLTLAHFSKGQTRLAGDFVKRAIDLAISAALLVLLVLPFALISALVKATSPGPIMFRQDRVGKDGRLFSIFKFRTMYRDAPPYSYSPGAGDDPRVTPVGRFLRRTSLDELPQLVNVLIGQMSLVGPRPEMPFIVEQYTPLQRRRLSVKPGITGLWQLSADRRFLIHENIEYDLYYLTNNPRFLWDIALQFSGVRRFEMGKR